MKALRLIAVWVLIAACVTGFGLLAMQRSSYSVPPQVEGTFFLTLGIGAASYLVAGFIIVSKVRAGRLGRGMAVTALAGLAIPSIIFPMLAMELFGGAAAWQYLSQEQRRELPEYSIGYAFNITLGALLLLAIATACVRKT